MATESKEPRSDQDEWARRRASSVRLGLILGGVALALFLISIWKYRPL